MNKLERFEKYGFIKQNKRLIADITKRANAVSAVKEDDVITGNYYIEDGETAWSLAQDFYNDTDYYWLVLLVNPVIDPFFHWPLTTVELERFVFNKYGAAADSVHSYLLGDRSYENSPSPEAYPLSFREYEHNLNETRRKIRIIRPEWLDRVIDEYKRRL